MYHENGMEIIAERNIFKTSFNKIICVKLEKLVNETMIAC